MGGGKPRIGISACLLGKTVRYNGGHCREDWVVDVFSDAVELSPVCPEVEMGLGVPRETIRQVRGPDRGESPRLLTAKTGRDLTESASRTATRILDRFDARQAELDGFILKKASPTCGQERVKVYPPTGIPLLEGVGVFAAALMKRYPLLPVIEEGRLTDPEQRDQFVTRVFAHYRFRVLPRRIAALQLFHQQHKLLLMAHSPSLTTRLGKIAANSDGAPTAEVFARYEADLFRALAIPSTNARRTNVLEHAFGYLKNLIDSAEKKQVLEVLEDYRNGELPLAAPVAVLRHLIRKFNVAYLLEQVFFGPFPKTLTHKPPRRAA